MFAHSIFNQDISNWNVSNVTDMGTLFFKSEFNQNITGWDVSNVTNMDYAFANSKFNQNLDNWTPKKLESKDAVFEGLPLKSGDNPPYWVNINIEFLEQAIDAYQLQKHLNKNLACVPTKESTIKTAIKI